MTQDPSTPPRDAPAPTAGWPAYPPPYLLPDDDEEVSLGELARWLWRRKWLIGACSFVGAVLAVVLVLVTEPVYRVETLLAPMQAEEGGTLSQLAGQFGGLASMAGISLGSGGGGDTEVALALLQSHQFLERFLRERALLPALFEEDWDADAGAWRLENEGDKPPTYRRGVQRFRKHLLSVRQDIDSGLVTVAVEWTDREQAADWISDLVQRVNEAMRARAIADATSSLDYLNAQLEQTSVVGVRQAIYSLMESQTQALMLAQVRDQYTFEVIDPPAIPSDDEKIRPKGVFSLVLGLLCGFLFSIVVAYVMDLSRGCDD
ncbi:MAG: Wzz/FepE/Etk N-terminal domain-containing protein [Pseudomonadota bacterium]|nr:Wzz/FepE/Etk N-terminal domain-containing protein [Pseudomonadota bacterium]